MKTDGMISSVNNNSTPNMYNVLNQSVSINNYLTITSKICFKDRDYLLISIELYAYRNLRTWNQIAGVVVPRPYFFA